jgi:hypothetical protein
VGVDLNEIAALSGPEAYEFSAMGQALMNKIAAAGLPHTKQFLGIVAPLLA